MKKLWKILGYLILALLAAIVAGYAYINARGGKDWLARTISAAASDPKSGLTVAIVGIDGSVPWDIRIAEVKLADTQGEFASLQGLHVSWEAWPLLHKKIHVTALEAEKISVLRQPALPPAPPAPPQPSQPFSLPQLPDIAVDRLHIPAIFIGAALAGSDQQFSLEGGGTPADWKLALKTLEGPVTSLNLTLSLLPASLRAHAELAEEPGGVLLHLLRQSGSSSLQLTLDADTDATVVHLRQLNLMLGGLSLKGRGSYTLADQRSDLQAALSIADAATFSELAKTPLTGETDLSFTANGPPDALAVKLDAALDHFAVGATSIPNAKTSLTATLNIPKQKAEVKNTLQGTVNGTPVSLSLESASEGMRVSVSHLEAGYGPYRAQVTGEADAQSHTFKVAVTSPLPPLSVVAPQLRLEGAGQAKIDAEGTFDAFKVNAQADITSKEGDAKLTAEGNVEPAKQAFVGRLNANATRNGQHFTLALPVKADASEVDISGAALDGPGMKLAAKLRWSMKDMLGDGSFRLNASDLRPLGVLTGQKLGGRIDADATLASREKKESVRMKLAAKDVEANRVALSQASLEADVQDLFGGLRVAMKLTAGPVTAGSTQVEKLSLDASGTPAEAMAVALSSKGSAGGKPFSVTLNGGSRRDAATPGLLHVRLEKFVGVYDAAPIALASPVDLALSGQAVTLSPLTLKFADGVITAEGRQNAGVVSGRLKVEHLHLDKLPAAGLPRGMFDAKLNIKGAPSAPELTLDNTLNADAGGQPVKEHSSLNWRKGRLVLISDASLAGAKAHAEFNVQAPLSLAPFAMGLSGTSPVQGKVTLDAALASFNSFLRSSGQRVSGKVAGDMKVAGKLAEPAVQGKITLSDGQYSQEDSGVCVRGLSAEINGAGDHMSLQRLDAASAEGETMHAEASAALTGGKELRGKVSFHNYRLFCGGLASGTIEGDLAASGRLDAATLAGTLTFPRMNIELPGNAAGGGNIPVVNTVRVDPDAAHTAKPAAPPGTGNAPLTFGVNIHVPGQMFVRGRGLDAEFKGDLAIKGPADNPSVTGLFESRRGQFELLDKTLKLISAEMRFEGAIPPSPFLDIKAESVTSTITIDVNVNGPAAKPDLTLSSTPSLPQDEILAQLLFGRELSSLGPFQVAQLAQATATLAGYESGPGVLGKVRSLFGVDTLNVGNDTNNDVNVGAGKYITDKIYVGVTQGSKPESRAVTTEVEVYPHVSATTGVTADGQQNLGLQWKYDY